jgi:hypothetical protein
MGSSGLIGPSKEGSVMNRPSTVSVVSAHDRPIAGAPPTLPARHGFMAGQSIAFMENRQISARNLCMCRQNFNSTARFQRLPQPRAKPRVNDPAESDQITRFTKITSFSTQTDLISTVSSRCPFLLIILGMARDLPLGIVFRAANGLRVVSAMAIVNKPPRESKEQKSSNVNLK